MITGTGFACFVFFYFSGDLHSHLSSDGVTSRTGEAGRGGRGWQSGTYFVVDGKVPTRAIEGGVGCEHDTEIWNLRPLVRSILIIRKEFANSNANPTDNITLGIVTDCVYFW